MEKSKSSCMLSYLRLLRLHQWPKNLFVLIPLVFSRKFLELESLQLGIFAFLVFMFASGATYVFNDLLDYQKDRLHPDKKLRPIAGGVILPTQAFVFWIFLLFTTLSAALAISWSFFMVISGYLLMMLSYSLFLKKILFVDVILIALGFVFRVLGGGSAIGITVSEWMIVLVFLFTLFLAISKRRQEIKNLEKRSKKTREVLTAYTIDLIDQLNAILVPIVMTSYIIYTFSERENNPYFIATIPLVVYCFFRYLYLLKDSSFAESSRDYLADWQLMVVGFSWFVLVIVGLSV